MLIKDYLEILIGMNSLRSKRLSKITKETSSMILSKRFVLFSVPVSICLLFLFLISNSEIYRMKKTLTVDSIQQYNTPGGVKDANNTSDNGVRLSTKGGVVVKLWPTNIMDAIENIGKQNALEKLKMMPKRPPPEAPRPISEKRIPCTRRNIDCIRFQDLLNSWPIDKPKAAFYIITRRRRLSSLKEVLQSIDAYFNYKFHYPVIIFHEEDFIPSISEVLSYTKSDLYFQEITFQVPDFLLGKVPVDIICTSRVSYRHMCHFNAKGVFQQPIMRGLEYYWRLDDDSLLTRDVTYDVFRFMKSRGLTYGYIWRHLDSHDCVKGLWSATRKYIQDTGIKPGFFPEWQEPYLYYNNFEISKMSVWLSKSYADYIEYIDHQGGIYFHRWGDAPIKAIAVSLFVPKNHIHNFSDIGYSHGSFKMP